MKKFIALFLIIAFIGMNCATYKKGEGINLAPGQKPGVIIIIQKTDGHQVKGELIAVKDNSLLLLSESGTDVLVGIRDIKVIKIVKKSNIGYGFLIGAAAFAAFGALAYRPSSFFDLGRGVEATMYGLLGGLLGILYAAIAGSDEIIQIEGKSDSEIEEALEKLRKKARVPDFQ